MFTLQLFGGCTLVANGEPVTGQATQRRRLALLALIATSPAGISRDKLVAYLWPEDDSERARHFLADSLFRLRKELRKDFLVAAGNEVRVNAAALDVDVLQFETLAGRGDLAGAVALYRGPFLDGFFVAAAPEFERWTDAERDRLARRYAWCLDQLATQREAESDWAGAAEWWRRLAGHDPYSSRVTLRTMHALAENGDVAGALRHARLHEARVRKDLGLQCNATVVALAERLRSRPAPSASERAAAPLRADAVPTELPVTRPTSAAPVAEYSRVQRVSPRLTLVAATLVALVAFASMLLARAQRDKLPSPGGFGGSVAHASAGAVPERDRAMRSRREEARDFYTQGRYYLTKGQFDPAIHARALQLFSQAAERDPSFALAYAGMADVYNHADEPARAKQAALRAIALDSVMAEPYTALAYVLAFYEYRWDAADSALQRAIALNPRYVLAHLRRANVLAAQGRIGEAVSAVERAREIQPESFVVLLNRGFMADLAGRADEAIGHFQAALTMEPGRVDAQEMLKRAYWGQGRHAEAQGVMRSIGNLAGVIAMSGNRDTMAMLAPVLAASNVADSIRHAAALYVRLGRSAQAFEQLDRLYLRRDKHLALTLRQQPFVSLRGDPRYARFLARMGLR